MEMDSSFAAFAEAPPTGWDLPAAPGHVRIGGVEIETRDRDRDVSEKIALGLAQPSGQDMQFDQRLFNQTAGMDSGFGDEDGYNLYDKRLFEGSGANAVYRPKSNAEDFAKDEDAVMASTLKNARFKVDNEFSGASGGAAGPRSGPVDFDKSQDVFGLDEFMQSAKGKGGDEHRDRR